MSRFGHVMPPHLSEDYLILRTSNGMSPGSTLFIQIPPSNPPRPSPSESQNSEKFSWAEDVEGYDDPVN